MKEAYVSFEVAKLLKEKGFDGLCYGIWHIYNEVFELHYEPLDYSNLRDEMLLAPTQQMAMRWLREEYNILVTVQPCEVGAGVDDYTYIIYEIQPEDYHFKFIAQGRVQPVAYTMDYEGTLEEGIKHALINLI